MVNASASAGGLWGTSREIKKVINRNMAALEAESIKDTLATIHTEASAYCSAKRMCIIMFEDYDVSYQLVSYEYLGRSGEYAVARVRQRAIKGKDQGPELENNETDLLQVFRKEDGVWKIWLQSVLSSTKLE
jgi:hypothetical protein